MRRLFILFLIAVSASVLSANGGAQAPDNKGTDFFVAFPQNVSMPPVSFPLTVFVAAEEATTVEISGPEVSGSPLFFSLPALSVLGFPLSSTSQVSLVNQVGAEGIRVRSVDPLDPTKEGAPVAVYGLNRRPGSAGAYMALPVDVLGKEYRALSRPGISPTATGSQVTIVGTKENTMVTVTTRVAVPNVTVAGITFNVVPGVPFNVVLNPLQTFLLQLQVGDLTGTLVTADKPVAVFSGNQNGTVTDSSVVGSADHMVEQMVPVSAWGNEFIVAPIAPNTIGDSIVRVLAHYDGTIVTVNGEVVKVNGENKLFAAGTFHEFTQSSSSASLVETSKPTLVAQYKEGDRSGTGPFVMLAPPVRQFSRQYLFATPLLGTTAENHQLNIVVKEQGDEAGLLLDFAPLPAGTTWTAVNGYRYATVPIPKPPAPKPGTPPPIFAAHLLEHQEPSVRFGAWAYGHALGEGYGYAAGQLVNTAPDCSAAVASTPLIWPPNHQLASIGVNGVSDPDNDDVSIEVATIRQDEPTNETGDGDTAVDGFGIGTKMAQVRSERSGGGNGRVYHIGFTATDPWGGSCSGEVTVGVPHDQGKKGAPVDDGAVYDSTGL